MSLTSSERWALQLVLLIAVAPWLRSGAPEESRSAASYTSKRQVDVEAMEDFAT